MNGAANAAPFAHPSESHGKDRPAEAELETIAAEARTFDAGAGGGRIAGASDTPEAADASRLSVLDRRTSRVRAGEAAPSEVGSATVRRNWARERRRTTGRFRLEAPRSIVVAP